MKILLAIAFSVLIQSLDTNAWDFTFYDTANLRYHTKTLAHDIQQNHNFSAQIEHVLLLLTPSLSDTRFIEQAGIIDSLDAEDLRFVTIVSCASKEYRDGYHTDRKTAKLLLKEHPEVRLVILDQRARPVYSAKNKCGVQQLKGLLVTE
jgi:hypothetical protein